MNTSLLQSPLSDNDRRDLVALLQACVEGGASIGFIAPLGVVDAEAYWQRVEAELPAEYRLLFGARDEAGRIVGTVQLVAETRRNGRHRAEIQKLLVSPAHRGHGLGSQLMAQAETTARARSLTLLFLDTSEGPGGARRFYEQLGYRYAGGIPGYALDPDGTLRANAIFYKTLAADG